MRTIVRYVLAAGFVLGLAAGPAGAQEKKIEVALMGSLFFGNRFDGELAGLIGPSVRFDFHLRGPWMISPEATLFWYWWSLAPACTLNYRFGHGYVGLGPMVTWATHDGHGIGVIKLHVGVKGGHGLVEAAFVTGGRSSHTWGTRPALYGLTFGLVF